MAANASELYREMYAAVERCPWERAVAESASAMTQPTLEAVPGQTFTLFGPSHNYIDCRPVDEVWCAANLLHFFAATEDAEMLPKYNHLAERFLTDGQWIGAYGAIAIPQVAVCVERLKADKHSRAAVVSMGGPEPRDINRPACWSHLHFLFYRGALDLLVYQRSLNLVGVMPYDCVVLTNLLMYAAQKLGVPHGSLRWTVGSLHLRVTDYGKPLPTGQRNCGMVYPFELLDSPSECLLRLRGGTNVSASAT